MKKLLAFALALGVVTPALAVDPATRPGNAAYTLTNNDVYVVTSTAFTAARTWTLPFAAGTCIGQTCAPPQTQLEIADVGAAITATNTLTIAPQSGDTINGNAANIVLSAAGSRVVLKPTTANNWAAYVTGDYQSSAVASASAVALTTATAKTITSLALSQGVWFCDGALTRKLAATTSVTQLQTSIVSTTDTAGSLDTGTMKQFATAANVMATDFTDLVGPVRLAPAATTTYYLTAKDTFTVSTNAGYGQLYCRREK